MRISKLFRAIALPTALVFSGAAVFGATLKIGDPAPSLQVAKWVQGDPVTGFDSNHVYIVEFWATWCGPCRASIPHLNEVWQKFKSKDLIVIGQDCWEQDESNVPAFITKMGDKMTYRVALDDKSTEKDGAMAVTWMKAADQDGIPTAFIVNRHGQIAWVGHPMTMKEKDIEDILADKYDVAAAAKEYEKSKKAEEEQQALSQKLGRAIQSEDWDAAESAVTALEKTVPEAAKPQINMVRFKIAVGRKDYTGAAKLAETTSDLVPDNIPVQNELAWALATTTGVDKDGLTIAKKLAERANKAGDGKDFQVLDTLARVQFMTGQTNEAVANETKAVELAPEETKADMQKCLLDYKAGKLPNVKD